MSYKVDNTFVIQPEADQTCELCGKVEECRPYGPHGEQICYECGMKDEKTTTAKCRARILGAPDTTSDAN